MFTTIDEEVGINATEEIGTIVCFFSLFRVLLFGAKISVSHYSNGRH